ncbi:HNH endonuclease signature motif containing protein [Nocardioides pyridinolyticus]
MAATTRIRAEEVLTAARDTATVIADAQVEQLVQAVQWAQLNPGDEPEPEIEWGMRPLEVAGAGAPTIDESAVAEFALAVGMKHEPGARLIGDAIELCYRLPRIWGRVMAGEVAVFKARKIAQDTRTLSPEAAAAVDQRLAIVASRCSWAEIERQVEQARAEHDPAEAERRRLAEAEQRGVQVQYRGISATGQVPITAWAGLADALAFDEFLTATAATLDPTLPLDVRRSMALGMVGTTGGTGEPAQRELVLYAHARPGQAMVEVENTRSVVTPEQVQEWCQEAGTRVTVRPVLDLAEEMSTGAYSPTPLMKEQVRARFRTCVFADCDRPARGCDLDHRDPYPHGATTTANLLPLVSRPSPAQDHRRLDLPTPRPPHHRVDLTHGPRPPTTYRLTPPRRHRRRG